MGIFGTARQDGWLPTAQLITLLTVWLIPAVGLALFGFAARQMEAAATRPPAPEYITVGSQSGGTPEAVTVHLNGSLRRSLPTPVAGVLVHHADSSPGQPVTDGQTLAQVGDRQVIANAGTLPFYRGLDRTSVGDDVARLNELLTALSLPAEGGDRATQFTGRTADGVRQLNQRINAPAGEVFHPESTVFVGPGAVLLGLAPSIGEDLNPGDDLATVVTAPRSVTFTGESNRSAIRWDYDRALIRASHGSEIELPREADAPTLAAFSAFVMAHGRTPAPTGPEAGDNSAPAFAGFRLSNAAGHTAALVPATSLHTAASGTTCVFAPTEEGGFEAVAVANISQSNKSGVVEVDATLAGRRIVTDIARLPHEVLSQC